MRWAAAVLVLGSLVEPGHAGWQEALAAAEADGETLSRIEILRRVVDREAPERRGELAGLWLRAGDAAMAARTLSGHEEQWPDLAAIAAARLSPDSAADALERELRRSPRSVPLAEEFVSVLSRTGKSAQVVAFLSASPLTEEEPSLAIRRAEARLELGDVSGALRDFDRALAAAGDHPAVTAAAPRFERLKAVAGRLQALGAAISKSPTDLEALATRGALWISVGRNPAAEADATAALGAHPGSIAARLIGALAARKPSWPSAERAPAPVREVPLDPDAAGDLARLDIAVAAGGRGALDLRAAALNAVGQPELALLDASASSGPAAAVEKIRALLALGRAGEAVAEAVRLERSKSRGAAGQAWVLVGNAQLREGDAALAAASATRAIAATPSPDAYKLRAAARTRMGDREGAGMDLAKADGS